MEDILDIHVANICSCNGYEIFKHCVCESPLPPLKGSDISVDQSTDCSGSSPKKTRRQKTWEIKLNI